MSSENDDERDGLASLFGGATPPSSASNRQSPRRAAAASRASRSASNAPASSGLSDAPASPGFSDAPRYPGLEPSGPPPHYPGLAPIAPEQPAPVSGPPSYTPAPAYAPSPSYAPPPAFTPEPPAFGTSAAPPVFPAPAYTPPAYAAPVEPPAPAPHGAFGEPVPDVVRPLTAPIQQPYIPPAYVPPVTLAPPPGVSAPNFGAPVTEPPTPGFAAPVYDVPAPLHEPAPSYESAPSFEPAPVSEPSRYSEGRYAAPQQPAPQYPGLAPSADAAYAPPSRVHQDPTPPNAAPQYPGLEPSSPAYPPTAQYPSGVTSAPPATTQSPASDPEPLTEPPPFSGFAALGLEPEPASPVDTFGAPPVDPLADSRRVPPDPGAQPADRYGSLDERARAVALADGAPAGSAPVLRRPPGPLLPSEHPVIESSDELARATTFEKAVFGIAVIGGPIGLVLAIVTGLRGLRRRGWLTALGRASIAVAVLSTIAAVAGGVALWNLRQAQLEHAEVAAASAEFCAAAVEHPEIVEPPLLGWPDPGPTISESLVLMQEWTTRWTELAAVSPAGLRPGLEALAARGGEVIAAVEQSRIINDAENERLIGAAANSSRVAAWHATYCATP